MDISKLQNNFINLIHLNISYLSNLFRLFNYYYKKFYQDENYLVKYIKYNVVFMLILEFNQIHDYYQHCMKSF